ncbi:MAG: DUF348 domain-containing protein, partial [Chloroflexi bacterium]|nr:DUF348 domain-containing protein [Chloroflexota bacterium]
MLGIGGWELKTYLQRPTITIEVNGNNYTVHTEAETVAGALEDADIHLDPADSVAPPVDTPLEPNMAIRVIKAHQLVLEIEGVVERIYTHETDPLAILAEQNITLHAEDQLYANHRPFSHETASSYNAPPDHLRIVRAQHFTLFDNGTLVAEGRTTAATVAELLDEHQLPLYLADHISPAPATPLTDGLTINIVRSQPVFVEVDGQKIATRAIGSTVADVLNMLGFPLTGQDYTIPAENTPFTPELTIQIVRVVETLELQQDPIPYQTLTYPDPDLPEGVRQLVQAGQEGQSETRILVRRENGRVVSHVVQSTRVVYPPVPEVVLYGTCLLYTS